MLRSRSLANRGVPKLLGGIFIAISVVAMAAAISNKAITFNPNKFAEAVYATPTPLPTPCGWFLFDNTCSRCKYGFSTDSWGTHYCNHEPYISVRQSGNQYTFTLKSYPDGVIGEIIHKVEQKLGRNYFNIKVDPSKDPYLKQIINDVNKSIPSGTDSLPTKQKIATIINAMNKTLGSYGTSYYLWSGSESNLMNYVGLGNQLLGDRIKKGYYTCFESALLAKTILSNWGISTNFDVLEIHIRLKSGNYIIEPLFNKVD